MHNAGVQKRAGKWVLLSPALRFRTTVGMGGWVGEASRFRSDLARWPESQAVNLQLHSSKRKSFRILITLFWPLPPPGRKYYRPCYSKLVRKADLPTELESAF